MSDRDRIGRYCDRCGQVDDHPRHTQANADGSTVDYHFDCCGCELCAQSLQSSGGKKGLELVDHITSGGTDHLNPNKSSEITLQEVPDDLSGLENK